MSWCKTPKTQSLKGWFPGHEPTIGGGWYQLLGNMTEADVIAKGAEVVQWIQSMQQIIERSQRVQGEVGQCICWQQRVQE